MDYWEIIHSHFKTIKTNNHTLIIKQLAVVFLCQNENRK